MRERGTILLVLVFLASIPSGTAISASSPQWPGFQTIIWQTKTARQYQALRELGVTAAKVQALRTGETPDSAREKVSPIVQAGLRPYVENIATDFYSAYHRWFPDRPVNAAFLALQKTIAADPTNKSVFVRVPSLSDPQALAGIKRRITEIVRIYSPYRPLFFDLGDETGIADLSAAWDFDFSQPSLSGMRRWLKGQYRTLAALNREWGTDFARWQDVTPPTTTETMMRTDGNYSAWSDFKRWMDLAYARAIRAGAQAIHAAAPQARAAIEGAQMPGWGGYDFTRLTPSVDVMEFYDKGQSLEIGRDFNPRLTFLMTVNWGQPGTLHRAWREFLRGVRGMVLWDPNDRLVNASGSLGPDGPLAAAFLTGIRKSPAALIMASRPTRAPIAVLYSPQSERLQWLIDHRRIGASWTQLSSDDENADNAARAARRRVLGLLDHLGVSPHFVSDAQIAASLLQQAHDKIVILPQALALSNKAAEAIGAFEDRGGIVIAEGQTGLFDGHGRRLPEARLSALLNGTHPRAFSLSIDRGMAKRQLAEALKTAAITPEVTVDNTGGDESIDVEHYVYRKGPLTMLALLAKDSTDVGRGDATARLSLRESAYVYDLGTHKFLGHVRQIAVSAKSTMPTLLGIFRTPLSIGTCRSLLHWRTCPSGHGP